jgi:hypothetical protein
VWQQVKPMLPVLVCGLCSGCVVWLLDRSHLIESDFLRLLIGAITLAVVYLAATLISKIQAAKDFIGLVTSFLKKIRHRWHLKFGV